MIQTREVAPTDGNGFSKAGIHKMQTSPPPGEISAPFVRSYTESESDVVGMDVVSPKDRLVRLLATTAIDLRRYVEASFEHPESASHMDHMIVTGLIAEDRWKNYYINEFDVDVEQAVDEARKLVDDAFLENDYGLEWPEAA